MIDGMRCTSHACSQDLGMHAWRFTCVLMGSRPRVVRIGSSLPQQGVDLKDGCDGAHSSGEELQLLQPLGALH